MKYFFGGDAELGDGVPASRLPVGDVFPGVAVLIVRARAAAADYADRGGT